MTLEPEASKTTRCDPDGWLERHGDAMFRYALVRVGDNNTAEDLVQEALLAAFKSENKFMGRSSERTWLIGILKFKVIDHLRARFREQPMDGEAMLALETEAAFRSNGLWSKNPEIWKQGLHQVVENSEFWEAFFACLSKLPPNLASVFALKELEGRPSNTICKDLGITPSNLWTMMHRARFRLRQCLEANWFTNGD